MEDNPVKEKKAVDDRQHERESSSLSLVIFPSFRFPKVVWKGRNPLGALLSRSK
jgi:hypothetical protein